MPAHIIIEATQTAGGDDQYFDLKNSPPQYQQIACLLPLLLGFALSPYTSLVVTLHSLSMLLSSKLLHLYNPLSQIVVLFSSSFNYFLYLKIFFLHFFPSAIPLAELPPSSCFAVHLFILPVAILLHPASALLSTLISPHTADDLCTPIL